MLLEKLDVIGKGMNCLDVQPEVGKGNFSWPDWPSAYSHLCSCDHSPMQNLQIHLCVVIPQEGSVKPFSVVFSPQGTLEQLLCHPNTSPMINLRKIRCLFERLTHAKRPAGVLCDNLFALPAVDFSECFSARSLVSHTKLSKIETPRGPPAPRWLHKQGCPLSACVSPGLVLPEPPVGGGHHPGAAQEHPTGCLDWELPGAPASVNTLLLHLGCLF